MKRLILFKGLLLTYTILLTSLLPCLAPQFSSQSFLADPTGTSGFKLYEKSRPQIYIKSTLRDIYD